MIVTDRDGGVSTGGRASLDLGTIGHPDPASVATNHEVLRLAWAVDDVAVMDQVHGSEVAWAEPGGWVVPRADALLARVPGRGLLARAADCVPIALADAEAHLVGVVHAGRQGVVAGVVSAAVGALRDAGATHLRAWVGPRVCGQCYEVPDDLAAEVERVVPGTRSRTSWGTPALDLGAAVIAQLGAAEVEVTDLGGCTIEDESLFSYRRQGVDSGRHAIGVVLR